VQLPGHAEVHEQRRAVCPGDQPLTVPLRIAEPAAAQRPFKLPGADITEHPGIGHLDTLHPAPGAMLSQHRAEALHIWQLRHPARLPNRP
jgi:hypothetical protein